MAVTSKADRTRALAQALMQGAVTPPQGQMIGRYYVGEGVGSGLTRIGQALLANRMYGKADDADKELAAQKAGKAQAAYDSLVRSVGQQDADGVPVDGVGPVIPHKRNATQQEIGAALLKYQQDTGIQPDKNVVGLLAPGADGSNDKAFGNTLRRNGHTFQLTKTGELIDLGEGFDEPTRALDVGGAFVIQPTLGAPRTIGTVDKGVSPDAKFKVDTAPAVAGAEAAARAAAGRDQENIGKVQEIQAPLNIVDRMAKLASDGAYTGSLGDKAVMYGKTKGIGKTDKKYDNSKAIDQLQTDLLMMSKPPGMGAMSDPEWDMLKKGVPIRENFPDTESFLSAVQTYRDTLDQKAKIYSKQGAAKPAPVNASPGARPPLSSLIPIGGR